MSDNVNSKVQASVWLKPDQLDALRTAVYRCRPDYLQERDDTILTLMYDTGVRVGELVAIDTDHLRDDNSVLYLPAHIQKEYPTDNSPSAARLGLATDTTRTVTSYLSQRWKDTTALFPSRSSERIMVSTRSENWLRIRGVETCFCLFTDPVESVNRSLYAFPQIHRIGACINLFYTL